MKNVKLLCTILFIMVVWNAPVLNAQTAEQLEESLRKISVDLQEKTLKLNWSLTEEYLKYCEKSNQLIKFNDEDYLKTLVTLKKPKELSSYDNAYENTKSELENYLMTFEEYIRIDSLRRNVNSEEERKNVTAASSSFRNWLWNKDKKYKELSNKNQLALRKYNLEATKYMFNEYKSAGRAMPSSIIPYGERQYLLSNNAELKLLSDEVEQLSNLQKKVTSKYQKLKYNIDPDEKDDIPTRVRP